MYRFLVCCELVILELRIHVEKVLLTEEKQLFQSCATLDQDTGMGRGFLLLSQANKQEHEDGTE